MVVVILCALLPRFPTAMTDVQYGLCSIAYVVLLMTVMVVLILCALLPRFPSAMTDLRVM
jgi:hypothetical protein